MSDNKSEWHWKSAEMLCSSARFVTKPEILLIIFFYKNTHISILKSNLYSHFLNKVHVELGLAEKKNQLSSIYL